MNEPFCSNFIKRLVDMIGAILQRSSMATDAEKSDIMVGPSIIKTIHTLIMGAIGELQYTAPLDVSSHEIGIYVLQGDSRAMKPK